MRSVPGDEVRMLLLTKEKLKLRRKGRTEWKHDYSAGLAVHLSRELRAAGHLCQEPSEQRWRRSPHSSDGEAA